MMGEPNAFRELLRDAVDDDRLYQMRFRASGVEGHMEPNADELESELRDEAERIERTVGCVTTVVCDESGRLGPADYFNIYLFAILPRHTDMDLFHRVMDESRNRVMTRCHEQ